MPNCEKGDTAVVVLNKHPTLNTWVDNDLVGRFVKCVEEMHRDVTGPMWRIEEPIRTQATERMRLADGRLLHPGDWYIALGMPDWCLQPIRPNKKPEAIPAPSIELTHQ